MTLTVGEALKAQMVGHTGLSGLISTRCYPLQIAQGSAMPCVTYQVVSLAPEQAFGDTASIIQSWRYQITAWGSSYSSANAVGVQVRACLDGFAGTLGTSGPKAVITWRGGVDMLEPGSERWRVINDFEVWVNG